MNEDNSFMPIISTLMRLRLEDHKFEASLNYIARLSLKIFLLREDTFYIFI
jgi:hypothetical protein